MKRFVFAALCLALALCLAACAGKTPPQETYTYTPETDAAPSADETAALAVDTSWQENFDVAYLYYDRAQSPDSVEIEEKRAADSFFARYPASGNTVFYRRAADGVEQFTILPGEEKYIHTTLRGKDFGAISTTFMKLTALSPELPSLTGVTYEGEDVIAGRPAVKYSQTAYAGGEVSETALIWADKEYGFSLKCEAYDKDGILTASWTVERFSSGTVAAEDAAVDLSGYSFTEAE